MPEEWACECGYITPVEPESGKCPVCGSKMTKIDGEEQEAEGDDKYDEEELLTPIDDDMIWEDIEEDKAEE